jgi:hypothetical protein
VSADELTALSDVAAFAARVRGREVSVEGHDGDLWRIRLAIHSDADLNLYLPKYDGPPPPVGEGVVARGRKTRLTLEEVRAAWPEWEMLWRCAYSLGHRDLTLSRTRLRDWLGISDEKARVWKHAMLDIRAIEVSRTSRSRHSSREITYYQLYW